MIGLLGFELVSNGEQLVRIALPHVVARMHFRVVHSSTQGGGKTALAGMAGTESVQDCLGSWGKFRHRSDVDYWGWIGVNESSNHSLLLLQ